MLVVTVSGYKGDKMTKPDGKKETYSLVDLESDVKKMVMACDHKDCFTGCDRELVGFVEDESECALLVIPNAVPGKTQIIEYNFDMWFMKEESIKRDVEQYAPVFRKSFRSFLQERFPDARLVEI